jgi:hypothetical protein
MPLTKSPMLYQHAGIIRVLNTVFICFYQVFIALGEDSRMRN